MDEQKDSNSTISGIDRFEQFSNRQIQFGTEPIPGEASVEEELIEKNSSSPLPMTAKVLVHPKNSIEFDPQYWLEKEEEIRKYVRKVDPNLSRWDSEHNPILTAPSYDLLKRMLFLDDAILTKSFANDPPDVKAGRLIVRLIAELTDTQHDIMWTLNAIRSFQNLPFTGFGAYMNALANFNKINTALAQLETVPWNTDFENLFFKVARPSARKAKGSKHSRASAFIRIPMCVFGVSHVNRARVQFTSQGRYPDTINALGYKFYPTHINSVDARDYGWISSVTNFALNGDATPISEAGYPSPELCPDAKDITKLFHSLIKHLEWGIQKYLMILGSNQRGIALNRECLNSSFSLDNSKYLFQILTTPLAGFQGSFNSKNFSDRVFDNLMNPLDDKEYVKKRMTKYSKIHPMRQGVVLTRLGGVLGDKDHMMYMRSSDTIFGTDHTQYRGEVVQLTYQPLIKRLLRFYKAGAVEYIDANAQRYATLNTDSPMKYNKPVVPDPTDVKFRPDVVFACVPASDALEAEMKVVMTSNPIMLKGWSLAGILPEDALRRQEKCYIEESAYADDTVVDGKISQTFKIQDFWNSGDTDYPHNQESVDDNYKRLPLRAILPKLVSSLSVDECGSDEDQASESFTFPSSNAEIVNLLSSMDNVMVYGDKEEIKSNFTLSINTTFVDSVIAHDCTVDQVIDNTDLITDKDIYDSMLNKVTDAEVASRIFKPWIMRSAVNEGDNLDDDFYMIDYEVISSAPAGTHIFKSDFTADYINNARLAFFQLRPTSVDCELVDTLNVDREVDLMLTGGRIADNRNAVLCNKGLAMAAVTGIKPIDCLTAYLSNENVRFVTTWPGRSYTLCSPYSEGGLGHGIPFDKGGILNKYDAVMVIRPYSVFNPELTPLHSALEADSAQELIIGMGIFYTNLQHQYMLNMGIIADAVAQGNFRPSYISNKAYQKIKSYQKANSLFLKVTSLFLDSKNIYELVRDLPLDSSGTMEYLKHLTNYSKFSRKDLPESNAGRDNAKRGGREMFPTKHNLGARKTKKWNKKKNISKKGSTNFADKSKKENEKFVEKMETKPISFKNDLDKKNKSENNDGASV